MNEVWKEIPNFEKYEASSLGRIRNRKTLRVLKTFVNNMGYERVGIRDSKSAKTAYVHRLVAMSFIKNSLNKSDVNHIDGNKLNNELSNLEWASSSENNQHARDSGLHSGIGETHYLSVLTESDVKNIRKIYSERNISQNKIAIMFNVSHGTIWAILNGKTWKNI